MSPEADGPVRVGASAEVSRNRRYFVSYARADASDPGREKEVDRLCEEAKKRQIDVLRDKTHLHQGELNSTFMKRLGDGDRVFIFLSDKYLLSSYCMFELFELWRNSKQDKVDFLQRVRVFSIDGVKINGSTERLVYTKAWIVNRDQLRNLINDIGWEEVGERTLEEYFRMKKFASEVSDVLAAFADVVRAETFEEFLIHGLDAPPEVDRQL